MGEVRAIDGRYTVALGNGQTCRFHGFQFAVRGGEAHPARARECADAPAGPVGPEPPKKLPTCTTCHQIIEHSASLSD
jgi:hypothetical protein